MRSPFATLDMISAAGVFVLLATQVLASSPESSRNLRGRKTQQSNGIIRDTIVIGAGWSGIGAARTLVDNGVTNIEIIEARDYVGGRCRTVNMTAPEDSEDDSKGDAEIPVPVELGCQWIHGSGPTNPITQLAWQNNLTLAESFAVASTYSNVYGGRSPKMLDPRDVDANVERDFTEGFLPYQADLQERLENDASLRDIATGYERERGITGDRLLHLEHTLNSIIAKEENTDLEELSLWWWDNGKVHAENDERIIVEGYSTLIENYAEPIKDKISFESVVTSINWSNNLVEVTYMKDSSEETVRARNVIVTLPIGVLKAGSVSFLPPLPIRKQQAIDRLGSGSFVKSFLSWDEDADLPWNEENDFFLESINSLDKTTQWNEFYNNFPTLGTNSILGISTGKEARRIEGLSDTEILDEMMAAFSTMFGTDRVPSPTGFKVSRWNADPYSQGAYSFMALGSSPRDRDALREAMTGSMFWAGEASNTNYAATAHGAIASGWAAGEQALKNLGVDVTVEPVSVPAPTAAPLLITTPEGEVTIAPPPCPAGSYANFDWDELPDCSKDIAKSLGYNKGLWSDEGTPAAINEEWSDLTTQQKDSLERLGFNEGNWC